MSRTLRALKIEIRTKEGIFETEKHAHIFFEYTKDINEAITEITVEVRKMLNKSLKGWNRPTVTLTAMDESYGAMDFFRYVAEYPGETAFMKFNPVNNCYEEKERVEYKKRDGVKDTAKQARELADRLKQDAIDVALNFERMPYRTI